MVKAGIQKGIIEIFSNEKDRIVKKIFVILAYGELSESRLKPE